MVIVRKWRMAFLEYWVLIKLLLLNTILVGDAPRKWGASPAKTVLVSVFALSHFLLAEDQQKMILEIIMEQWRCSVYLKY